MIFLPGCVLHILYRCHSKHLCGSQDTLFGRKRKGKTVSKHMFVKIALLKWSLYPPFAASKTVKYVGRKEANVFCWQQIWKVIYSLLLSVDWPSAQWKWETILAGVHTPPKQANVHLKLDNFFSVALPQSYWLYWSWWYVEHGGARVGIYEYGNMKIDILKYVANKTHPTFGQICPSYGQNPPK